MILHLESIQTILMPLLMLGIAWIAGSWLGEAAFGWKWTRPTIGAYMAVVFVLAMGLALIGRDPDSALFALAMVPPIALYSFLCRLR